MKAILEFNLPEEKEEFELAVNSVKWYSVCWQLDQYLRDKTKYAPDSMPNEVYEALSETRNTLRELLIENNVNFDL
jgi:hypothetical protein